MTCVCGAPGERAMLPNPFTGAPLEYVWCSHPLCRREYVLTPAGPRWIKSAQWCQDAECDAPTFVLVQHPRFRHLMPLWPTPDAMVASYLARPKARRGKWPAKFRPGKDSQTFQYYCSAACAPDLGATPHHPMEMDGAPHPDAIGPCVAVQRSAVFHPECFTDERGAFYRQWLAEEFHFAAAQLAALMTTWERARHG